MSKTLKMPKESFFGQGALERALPSLCKYGKKAIIVTGNSMIRQGFVKELQEKLSYRQVETTVFNGVFGEPTERMVDDGVRKYRQEQCDFIIGFGGGSQLDAAKAIVKGCL